VTFSKETELGLTHAWNWFSLHAGQRMQSFNFFLIATAFMVAAYGTVLDKHRVVAFGIAMLGAWVCFWFNRMERRTKQLVKAGEQALSPFQELLARSTDVDALRIVNHVETKENGSSSYSVVIDMIQRTVLLGFAVAALYAVLKEPSAVPSLSQVLEKVRAFVSGSS